MMTDDFDREKRKNKNKNSLSKNRMKDSYDISEEQRFLSKSKKAFKNKIQHIRSEEMWEDWEEME